MNRRNTRKPPRASTLLAVIERLESRAMLAGLGQDSLSGLGSITAVLLPGVSPPPGIIFNGGSPTLGSAAGTGGSRSNGPVLLGGSGSGTGSSSSGSSSSAPTGPVLSSQYTSRSNTGGQGRGTNNSGTHSGSDLWLLYGVGLGAASSSSGASGGSSPNFLPLLTQYTEGSNAGGQGNGTEGTLSNADLWNLYWSGSGAGSSSSGSDEGSLADDPTISAQYTGGSGIGCITPLVYNPQSDGPPVFHSGVWTGDEGGVQFVNAGDPDGEEGVRQTFSYEEVDDIWPIEREDYERQVEEGKWDVPEPPKPKDEFDSIPTDENGNYSWLSRQKYSDFLGQIVQTGKAFAWHMAEWFGPDEVARAAKPVIAGGKGLAIIAFGAGKADNLDDLAKAAFMTRYGKYVSKFDGYKHALDLDHLKAALAEKNGVVLKINPKNGLPFDHLLETRNAMNGLYDRIPLLKKYLGDPSLTPEQRDLIKKELGEISTLLDRAEQILGENAGMMP